MVPRAFAAALLMLIVHGTPVLVHAQIYRWTDDQGHGHYSEGIDTIPERYRSRAAPIGLTNRAAPPSGRNVPDRVPANGAVVPFAPGERILVSAMLNGRTTVRLLLDTGADQSSLPATESCRKVTQIQACSSASCAAVPALHRL